MSIKNLKCNKNRDDVKAVFNKTCLTCKGLTVINGKYIKNAICPVRYTRCHIITDCEFWKESEDSKK